MVMTESQLLDAARDAAKFAYCPYSKFHVGAALIADGVLFSGCNVENASYGLTICAERVAAFSALAAGKKRIEVIAVTCPDAVLDVSTDYLMPCGACRQVLFEFGGPDLTVIIDRVGTMRLSELLPNAFKLL
jgi:cytidine deaminase